MNGVRVLPKKRRPACRKCPESREPPVQKRRREYPQVRMIVEIYAYVDPRDPPKRACRGQHKCSSRPRPVNAHHCRMFVQPERARVRRQTSNMEDHTVNILRMRENPPVARLQLLRPFESARDCAHANLNAVSS